MKKTFLLFALVISIVLSTTTVTFAMDNDQPPLKGAAAITIIK